MSMWSRHSRRSVLNQRSAIAFAGGAWACRFQKSVTVSDQQRGPGERANASLKSWKILRRIRCCPLRATSLVQAVLVLILAG